MALLRRFSALRELTGRLQASRERFGVSLDRNRESAEAVVRQATEKAREVARQHTIPIRKLAQGGSFSLFERLGPDDAPPRESASAPPPSAPPPNAAPASPPPARVARRPMRKDTLLASLHQVASAWHGHAHVENHGHSGDAPTPEELVHVARAQGLELAYALRNLASLRPADFPCIIVDDESRAIILEQRNPDGSLRCRAGEDCLDLRESDLAPHFSGVVFFVKPHADTHAHDAATPVEFLDAKPRGLIGAVFYELRQSHTRDMIYLSLAAGVSNLLLLAMPVFSMAVYDRVIPHFALETLWALAIGITLALIVDFGLRAARIRLTEAVALSVSTTLQTRYFARIMRAKAGAVPTLSGSLQAGLREIENVCQLLPGLFVCLLVDVPFFLLATILLIALSGWVAVVPWITAVVAIGVHLAADLRNERIRQSTRLNATQSNLLVESIAGRETAQALGASNFLLRRWERLTDSAAYAGHLTRLHGSISAVAAMTVGQFAIVATILFSVYQIGAGLMTIGALSAATMIVGRMLAPMTQLGMFLHRLKQIRGSVATVEAVMHAPLESALDPSAASRSIRGEINFKQASFTYPGEKNPALNGINLRISPGEKVGLIGRAGSGKSTLLKCMVRLYDVSEGSFLIDQHDARQFSPDQIRRHFGYMRQDSTPFDDTLRNAVCFGLQGVTDEAFARAVMVAGVHEFASRHPSGYGLRVGLRGERLSGGERQAVMFARMLLSDPPAMLLDEPTSSMDNTTEMRLVSELRDIIRDKTFIVATHRAALLSLVDRLIWVEHGQIVADGPKAEVLKRMAAS